MRHTHAFDQLAAGNCRCTSAIDHKLDVFQFAPGKVAGIDQPRCCNDRCTVLIIMEYRNIHDFAQALLNDETFWRLDVFKVNAAKRCAKEAYAIDKLVNVFGRNFKVDAVNIGKAFEQNSLAFHHRLGRQRAKVTKTKNGGAVGNHRNDVALGGIIICRRRVLGDFKTGHRNTRRIRQGQIALSGQRLGRRDFDFARTAAGMKQQRFAVANLDF